MKVSFSRKGFDSSNGGQANAILPDGTLLPFPIPGFAETDTYSSLKIGERNLYEIIKELRPRTKLMSDQSCHLDPDLRKDVKLRSENWLPAFGQAEQSLSELRNKNFKEGDLFLFFGWFRQTEWVKGKLKYVSRSKFPDIQLIYGYMQVGEIIDKNSHVPKWLADHPHTERLQRGSERDAIFLPTQNLSFMSELPGAAMLKYSEDLVLTAKGMSRSKWKLPTCFKDIQIGHAPKQPADGSYFQSCSIGQEMIWEATSETIEWLKRICSHIER